MFSTKQLFSAEEAFMRVGQSRETGCLIIMHAELTLRLFVENGEVTNAYADSAEGMVALDRALGIHDASHLWIPDATPPEKKLKVSVTAYALKHSIARDIHLAKTGKVSRVTASVPGNAVPAPRPDGPAFYLVAEDRPEEKLMIDKPTVIVGRDTSCDIILESFEVSRRHCLLQLTPRGLLFRDLNSTNGLLVNGFLAPEGFLNPGDQLSFGTYMVGVFCRKNEDLGKR
jgi:hypothetical protein